ncbi:hypothetical protein ZHAS_00013913 [Anopheles sinensis]|uniref:Flavin-containing monooxygenase n=1 Tax=Anopheles sinensis TaxID=74873 RepID=A0A084W6V3_ANOSI|nr:hypothetical protein ZHAS_00013913 [Anopheles sinensis]
MCSPMTKPKRYCIIGAGPAGLCTARHALALDDNPEVTVFEQTQQIGGLWNYTDNTGQDHNGIDITCMYTNLQTNLVKQGMGYPDYTIDEKASTFVRIVDVAKQLHGYVEKHQLEKVIKFEQQVVRVTRNFQHNMWDVLVKDLPNDRYHDYQFDFVLVCNGHYSSPVIPDFAGRETFRGRQLHSKDYRRSEHYSDDRVLIVGGGHSGVDIAPDVALHASRTILSHRSKDPLHTGDRVIQKPEVAKIIPSGAIFVDGSYEDVDVIIYCTGYRYSVPFISIDCGVAVHNNAITPLYYHCININQPTMAFIGLPFNACLMLMMDQQARFCLKFYSGAKKLPSREEMFAAWQRDNTERETRGLTGKLTHMLAGDLQQRYYDDLAQIAEIDSLKPVLAKMHADCINSKRQDVNFRSYEYQVIDDENFLKIKIPDNNNNAAGVA